MFDAFAHYLSYGATDQQTARELTGCYDGLLVPGTVAAFQSDGTRGFVLTLSASKRTRYVIDSRFPLFQQRARAPKKSHEALATLLGVPELINPARDPVPGDFIDAWVDSIAKGWLGFNGGYTQVSSKHFAKYAERLGEAVLPEQSAGPEYVLPPYTVAEGPDDPWWDVSQRLWGSSVRQAPGIGGAQRLVRVVAAQHPGALPALLQAAGEQRVVIWVNGLDELDTSSSGLRDLETYGRAIRSARDAGQQMFALYGGFFSVLMAGFGLNGSSHGIGYGENRAWIELPQSGPPPTRYYLPRAHRYISQDLALMLWRTARDLVVCECDECRGQTPAALDYHALMRHSVRCRHAEIDRWGTWPAALAAERLEADAAAFEDAIGWLDIPRNLRRQADQSHSHLRGWAGVLRALAIG